MSLDALTALAGTPPRQYLQRTTDAGTTALQDLYSQCIEAGLLPTAAAATDDIARLHSLFDVALDHGLGNLVLDYVTDVCADRLLTSSDPVAAFLLDGECVRRWCQKTLTICKGRLTSWLGRGLGFIASSGTLPKELAKLRALQLVVQALSPAVADPQQQHPGGTAGAAAAADAPAEVGEVARLIQCGTVLAWLSQQGLEARSATGRFPSEAEWRGVAAKRKDGAAPASLFVADTLAALALEGVAGLQYPPGGVERLVGGLFLAGGTSPAALRLKLSLLAYWLVDAGLLQPAQLVEGFRSAFHVPPQLTLSWVLRLHLDDAHLPEHVSVPGGNPALAAAAALLPEVDGRTLPFKALTAFLQRGDAPTALALLRQRGSAGAQQGLAAQPEGAGSAALQEASVAVAVLLGNGLLIEAYMQVKRHLATPLPSPPVASAAAQQAEQHAQQLIGQLLTWGLQSGQLHAIIRLPLGSLEEQVCCGWLAAQAAHFPQCGLILSLFYLLRGRTPEALLAYAQHGPAAGSGGEVQVQLEEVLRQAGMGLPSVQRALALRQAAMPAVQVADIAGLEVEDQRGSIALAAAVPALSADGQAPIVSEGPTLQEAPLLASVPALLALQRWQRVQQEGAVAAALEQVGASSTAAGAAPVPGPGEQQAPRQAFPPEQPQAQAHQQPASAVKGFLSGGLLGGPTPVAAAQKTPAPRFGGAGAGHNSRWAGGGVASSHPASLPEGVVGERDFDRMLGMAAPKAGAGGRFLRGSATRLARPT